MSVNQVIVIGRLTKDVELRSTTDGTKVASFTMAVNRDYGEDKADFFPVVVWRGAAESCAKYTRKGSLVCVVGRLQNRSWDAQDGSKRSVTEIIATHVEFLSKREEGETKPKAEPRVEQLSMVNEDLPF